MEARGGPRCGLVRPVWKGLARTTRMGLACKGWCGLALRAELWRRTPGQGTARLAWPHLARFAWEPNGQDRRGTARRCWIGEPGLGVIGQGWRRKARPGFVRPGKAGYDRRGQNGRHEDRRGLARRGWSGGAWIGKARLELVRWGRYGSSGFRKVWSGEAGLARIGKRGMPWRRKAMPVRQGRYGQRRLRAAR